MKRSKTPQGRYSVTGPGLSDVSYPDFGPAFSRTVTEAARRAHVGVDSTYYVRDLNDEVLAYSESFGETRSVTSVGPRSRS